VLGARQSDTDPVGGFEEPDLSEVVGANQRQEDDFILLTLVVVHIDHLDLPHFLPVNLVILDEGLDFEELPRIEGQNCELLKCVLLLLQDVPSEAHYHLGFLSICLRRHLII
jgi:hypothetical protein